MSHVVKCYYCGHSFDRDKEEFIQVNGRRYAHKACHEANENNKSQEQKDLETLENYIKKLFNETYINAKIRKQINQMREQYNYTYSGILKSLVYFFEIKGNSLEKANGGIGIVPFIYQDAYNYYYELFVAQQKNEHKRMEEYVVPTIEIIIPSPQRKPKEKPRFSFLDTED